MTISVEHENVSSNEGGVLKCFSCLAHGRIILELLDKPSNVESRLQSLAMAHDIVTKGKHDIKITYRHKPQAE